jgi:DegV family protein with EDD domain
MIHIVTDTDSNLPQTVADEYGIAMAPIHIIFGDEVLREYYEISAAEGYQRMARGALPTTSQPPVGEFKVIYEHILAQDPQASIISIHVSSKMSGTLESARQAAEMFPQADIRLFDSLSASLGQGLLAREAAGMARQGADVDAIITRLETMRAQKGEFFIVKTLSYLARSGRIGRASHLMGTMLEIKPVLTLVDGAVDSHSKCRTWQKAVATIIELVAEKAREGSGPLHLAIGHACNEEDAQTISGALQAALDPAVLLVGEIGPGLGAHLGEGTIGVCWTRTGGA